MGRDGMGVAFVTELKCSKYSALFSMALFLALSDVVSG